MNKLTTVLVFPCGAESGLEIHHALKDVMNIKVVGASKREDHARMVYKNYYGDFPNIEEPHFYEALNALIAKEKIDIILPTHDTVLVKLAQNEAIINAKVAVPGVFQADVCRSKKKLYELFKGYDFCPKVFAGPTKHYPYYAKLDEGQGSKGAYKIENDQDLTAVKDPTKYVFMEFLPHDEITIDCFTNKEGELLFVGPRLRKRVFDGVCVNSISVPLTDEIKEIGQIVSDKIGMRGSWYFQLKQNEKKQWKFLEASCKISGNMNVFRGLGVNFPLLMVYDYLGYDVKVIPNTYTLEVDRALNHRYRAYFEYKTVYIDFDDTITKNEEINPFVMYFVYQQKQAGKKIKLITKHQKDLQLTLERLKIHSGVFDEIIQIKMEDKKSDFINMLDEPILVDNAYGERLQVKEALGIPTFDVDAINTLIDFRE